MHFIRANHDAKVLGQEELPGRINYFIGQNPADWKTGLTTYRKVLVQGLYPGIDLVYHGNELRVEYDFQVAPGADPSVIGIRFEGADRVTIDEHGELILKIGAEEVRQPQPIFYELKDGVRQALRGRYRLLTGGTVGFSIDERNPRSPLVIDPVLTHSSFFGGRGADVALSVKVDSAGSVYLAGLTLSQITGTNVPSPPGFTNRFQGGATSGDGFVAKFDPTLTNLLFLTYLGGVADDGIYDMALDTSNNVYLTGFTDSTNFPVLLPGGSVVGLTNASHIAGAPNTNAPHPYPVDAFVTELSASGTNLVYSLYLGAEDADVGDGIAVDAAGNAYVTGYTFSTNFPIVNGFQNFLGGTNHTGNAFIAKITPGASSLAYSSYLGGTNIDEAQGIAVDTAGLAYITGFTASTNFPTTADALQGVLNGITNVPIANDAFVAQFDTTQAGAASLLYSSFLGGTNADGGNRITVDAQTNVYVTGYTYSPDFPNTVTNLLANGLVTNSATTPLNSDAFLTKLSFATSPPQFMFSTYFGGTNNDMGWDVALDPDGNAAYVVGITSSTNFPVFDYFGFLSPTNSGSNDVFVAVFTNDASAVLYSAYLGGDGHDYGFGIAADSQGSAYMVGRTLSTNFPGVAPFQTSLTSSNNAFLAKIDLTNRLLSVTIQTVPTNLLFTLDGTNYEAPVTFTNWSPGFPRTLTVPPVQLGNGNTQYVWASWSDRRFFTHTFAPVGDTTVTAFFGSQSASNSVAVVTNGVGSVSPNYRGQALIIGHRYTITASPGPGYLFSSWTGDFPTNTPTASFIMSSGVYLQANFIPNPFIPFQGRYAGLFYDTNGVAFPSSGYFSASLSPQGALSAAFQLAGKGYSFSGRVANDGSFSKSIMRPKLTTLTVTLQVDITGGNVINGQITDGTWTAQLVANRAVFSGANFCPQAGRYSLVIPSPETSPTQPGGAGYGSATVDFAGNVSFFGTLGEGTPVSQSTFVSAQGTWPFYATLYSGGGSVLGWMTFASLTNSDVSGSVIWEKPKQTTSRLYSAGFTNQAEVAGSYFSPFYFGGTNGAPMLGFTNGLVILQGGNLLAPITNHITLGRFNKITNLDTNRLNLGFQFNSGFFQGNVVDPVSHKTIPFNGAVVQKQNIGTGLSPGTNQSATVLLQSQ